MYCNGLRFVDIEEKEEEEEEEEKEEEEDVSVFIKQFVTPSILQSQFIDKGFQKTDNSVDIK